MNPLTAGLAVVVVVHGRPDGSARKPACLSRPPSFAHGTDGPRSRSTALEEIISRHVCHGESAIQMREAVRHRPS